MPAERISFRFGQISLDRYFIDTAFIAVFVFLNSIFARVPAITLVLGAVETLFLLYVLFFGSISSLAVTVLVLLSVNIENPGFALGNRDAVFYSVFHLPYVKSYLLLGIMLLAMARCFWHFCCPPFSRQTGFDRFYFMNLFLAVSAVPMVFLVLACNDNGMMAHTDMWRYVARDGYQTIHAVSVLTLVYVSMKKDAGFAGRLKNIAAAVLSGTSWAAAALVLCGNYYSMWGDEFYITCPLILFFAPGLILFLDEKHGWFHLLTGCMALLLQVRFTVGIAGTWWVYILLLLPAFFRKALSLGGPVKKLPVRLACLAVAAVAGCYVLQSGMLHQVSGQVSYKLASILDIFRGEGSLAEKFMGAGDSVRMRVEEIINAGLELLKKPYFLPFGKGFGGTVARHWGLSDWNVPGSTFSDIMIHYRTYSHFHISIAEIIINYGLAGIVLIVFLVKKFCLEYLAKDGNAWLVLGILWFVFFYSLYYSMNAGLAWICIGLYEKYEKDRSFS